MEIEEYYKPKVGKKPKPLDLNNKDYNVNLFSALNHKNGLIDVELEKEVVISRIAKDLYSSWKSAIRELLNNEYTSCLKAKELGLKPEIYFTLDPINRILEIEGINSLGISSKVFLDIMRYIGRSGNFEGIKVGQFGFGFKSYLMLSENIIIETYSYESKEKYAIMGKRGLAFDILPEPDRDYYGTKLILSIRSEIDFYELKSTILKYSKYKDDIDIHIVIKGDIKSGYYNKIDKGIYPVEKLTLEDSLKEFTKVGDDHMRFNYEDKDIEIMFDILGKIGSYNKYKILLIKTPILGSIKPLNGIHVVVNIKNERLYKPTMDRDRLTEKALEDLGLKVNQVIKLTLETYINQLDNYDKWLENPKYKILFGYMNIVDIDPKVLTIVENLKGYLECYGYYEKGTNWVIGKHHNMIYDLLRDKANIDYKDYYLCDKFSYAHMKPLVNSDKYAVFIKVENKSIFELFLQYGVKLFEKGKLKRKKRVKISLEGKCFTGHFNRADYRKMYVRNNKDIDIKNNYDRIIVLDKNISDYYDLFSSLQTSYCMIKANKGEIKAFKDYPNFMVLKDLIDENMNKVYKTTRFPITLKDLLESENEIKISDFHYYDVAHNHKDYIVIGDNNELFLLACMLLYRGKRIIIVPFNEESYQRSYRNSGFGNYSYNDNYNGHKIMEIKNMMFVLYHKYNDYYTIMRDMFNKGCSIGTIEKLFNLLRGNK